MEHLMDATPGWLAASCHDSNLVPCPFSVVDMDIEKHASHREFSTRQCISNEWIKHSDSLQPFIEEAAITAVHLTCSKCGSSKKTKTDQTKEKRTKKNRKKGVCM